MRTMTATQASRSFAALLDAAEHGEITVITRAGRRIAAIGPASAGNGGEVLELLTAPLPDEEFAADVLAARDAVTATGPAWPAD